jgi:NTP pyrophosphatase (non-canonical NTP hydrolase)
MSDLERRLAKDMGDYADKYSVNFDGFAEVAAGMVEEYGAASIAGIWKQADQNHRLYSATGSAEDDLRFLTLGLVGEAGELANFVKKRWRDGDPHLEACRKECADVLAYTMMVAQALGMTAADLIAVVEEKQHVFVKKMAARGTEKASTI